ncbi:MAG TPA: hydrogenase expression/formation protein HypE [Peptococcaceae bacterium]|nr:hydrogenase expression/formation protein HypE [Peptococcaceae bacterium]
MRKGEQGVVLLGHGSGGALTHRLIEEVFQGAFGNPILNEMLDSAVFDLPPGRVALTTDSFVVDPIFFPGGDIGKLAVCGTVNDLVVSGAKPLYLSAGFIIEEGFPLSDLQKVVSSMREAASQAGVSIVTGDTKVVGRGGADKLFINTTGVGVIPEGVCLSPRRIQVGDVILVSGPIGEHGLAILAQREGLAFTSPVYSDCFPLHRLAAAVLEAGGDGVRCMRDPTRGGLATTLNELASQSEKSFLVEEELIPVRREVAGACEMLGIEPLYLACEGRIVAVVAPEVSEHVVAAMRSLPEGEGAVEIGRVVTGEPGLVLMETELGATRILTMLEGEPLPRIC